MASLIIATARTNIVGKIYVIGAHGEIEGINPRIERAKKYTLANLLYWLSKDKGKKEYKVYLVVFI